MVAGLDITRPRSAPRVRRAATGRPRGSGTPVTAHAATLRALRLELKRLLALADAAHARAHLAALAPEGRADVIGQLIADVGELRRGILDDILTVATVEPESARRCRVDVAALLDVAIAEAAPLLGVLAQRATLMPQDGRITTTADPVILESLLCLAVAEVSELSMPRAELRLAVDADEGDVIVSILGRYPTRIPWRSVSVTPELARLAEAARASLEVMWDPDEGPTLVLRLPEQ